jgi:hypothetical protein
MLGHRINNGSASLLNVYARKNINTTRKKYCFKSPWGSNANTNIIKCVDSVTYYLNEHFTVFTLTDYNTTASRFLVQTPFGPPPPSSFFTEYLQISEHIHMHWESPTKWAQETFSSGSIPGRGERIFPLNSVSRPALGPTQPPVQWVPWSLSLG